MTADPKASDAGVPARSEVRPEDTWDLAPLYPSEAAWEEDFTRLRNSFEGISAFQGRMAEGAATVRAAFDIEQSVHQLLERLMQYASLKSSEDSSHAPSLDREARLESLLARIGEAFSFLAPELQALDDAAFAALIDAPELADWKISLTKLRRLKPHTLTASEERLLALGAPVLGGHSETFSQLTNVDMDFGRVTDEDGTPKPLTQASLSSFLERRAPSVRREAFDAFYREIESHRFTLASSLASSVRGDVFHARARNYSSALEASLFGDDVPVAVYDNLISSVRGRLPALHEYFELRRTVLGLEEIHHYDTYVPMVAEAGTHTPWDEAVNRVVDAVAPLGSDYVDALREGLTTGRWCDRYENKGKRSGAFSYGTYFGPPYILMNYKPDVLGDVYTLAHEAGHSMHSLLSRRTQCYQNYRYPIFLAEVASTFNEILLTGHLLSDTQEPAMRAYILNRQIDDIRGTLFRQTMFAEFEKAIHEAEESGEGLTLDRFRAIYRELLDAYFGPAFSIDEALELECLRIPHFYHSFYVYKYATGLSAAAALARSVTETGNASSYLEFLGTGGSLFPLEALSAAGVNMLEPAPVEAALDLFESRVAELKELIRPA
jgi:oligoendopeptidase F